MRKRDVFTFVWLVLVSWAIGAATFAFVARRALTEGVHQAAMPKQVLKSGVYEQLPTYVPPPPPPVDYTWRKPYVAVSASIPDEQKATSEQVASRLRLVPAPPKRMEFFNWVDAAPNKDVRIVGWNLAIDKIEQSGQQYQITVKVNPKLAGKTDIFTPDECIEMWTFDGESLEFVERSFNRRMRCVIY